MGTMDSNDYIIIPNGIQDGVAAAVVVMGTDKFCGRFLNSAAAGAQVDTTICSRVTPFKLSVFTDGDEAHGVSAVAMASKNEASAGVAGGTEPLGTMGFSLGFTQVAC